MYPAYIVVFGPCQPGLRLQGQPAWVALYRMLGTERKLKFDALKRQK